MLNLDLPPTEIYTLQDPGLDGLIRECMDQPVITFDTETSGLDITRDLPLFWSVAFGERKICLTADTLPAFAKVFGDDNKTFVGHNIKYDVHMLANRGIRVGGRWRDTSVMHAMLFENEQHGLKPVSKKLLGWGWSSFQETFKTKKRKVKGNQKYFIQQAAAGMKHLAGPEGFEPVELVIGEDSTLTKEALLWYWQHDPSALADYASNDAYGTMKLDQMLLDLLEKETIYSAYPTVYENMLHLYLDTEVPFTQVLWKCERNGVFVDQDYLAQTEKPVLARLDEIEREFARKAGRVIRLTSNDDLAAYLFGSTADNCLGLRPRKMTSGGKRGIQKPSVDEKVLQSLADECVEAELALEHRQLKKLLGTYITKIGSLVGPDRRLHPQYNQDTARTGRLSCIRRGTRIEVIRDVSKCPEGVPIEQVRPGDMVYAYDKDGALCLRRVKAAWKTGRRKLVRVHWQGSGHKHIGHLDCTPDHYIRRTDGEWVQAQHLQVGDRVFALSRSVNSWGYARLYPTGDEEIPREHRFIFEQMYGWTPEHVHHKNGNKLDNRLENLEGLSRGDHLKHHWDNVSDLTKEKHRRNGRARYEEGRTPAGFGHMKREDNPNWLGLTADQVLEHLEAEEWSITRAAKRAGRDFQTFKNYVIDAGFSMEEIKAYSREVRREKMLEGAAKARAAYSLDNPNRSLKGEGRRFQKLVNNHEILDVDDLGEEDDVYDLEIEDAHCFIANEICVHNSKAPNIQNQPTLENDKFGIRKSFIAEPGNTLLVFDYKALEMRLLAAAAHEEPMIEAFRQKRDPHMANASMIFNVPYEDVVEAKKIDKQVKDGVLPPSALTQRHHDLLGYRAAAKTLGFGLVYGMREGKLARDLKITRPEAVELRKKFMRQFPAVERLLSEAISDAIALNCKSYTYMGRRRHLPALLARRPLDRFQAERQCVNLVVQGCLPASVRVLTSKGLLPIGEIAPKGWAWTGQEWAQYERLNRGSWKRARIHLANGQVLECDTRHKILVVRDHGYEFVEFNDLSPDDRACLSMAAPREFGSESPSGLTSEDAYWMGFATGNGHAGERRGELTVTFGDRKQRYTKEDKAIAFSEYLTGLGFIHQAPRVHENKLTIRIESKAFRKQWEYQGYEWGKTAEFKKIPKTIWQGSLAIRQQFLLGLLDADGTTGDSPNSTSPPNLHMAAEELLREVQVLARTLGIESAFRGPFGPDDRAYRLDFNRAQLSRNLGYGETLYYRAPTSIMAPSFIIQQFLALTEEWQMPRGSYSTLRSRLRHGGSTSMYMIEEMALAAGVRDQLELYASSEVVHVEELPFEEETYTLSVDHPSHRFDGEGIIHKNSAADLVRMAMLKVSELHLEDSHHTFMLMQVHDELVFECPQEVADEVFPIIKEAMEHPFPTEMTVPIEVDGGRGHSWGNAK